MKTKQEKPWEYQFCAVHPTVQFRNEQERQDHLKTHAKTQHTPTPWQIGNTVKMKGGNRLYTITKVEGDKIWLTDDLSENAFEWAGSFESYSTPNVTNRKPYDEVADLFNQRRELMPHIQCHCGPEWTERDQHHPGCELEELWQRCEDEVFDEEENHDR